MLNLFRLDLWLEIQKKIGEAFQIAPEFPLLLGRIALGDEGQVDLDGRLSAFQNRDGLDPGGQGFADDRQRGRVDLGGKKKPVLILSITNFDGKEDRLSGIRDKGGLVVGSFHSFGRLFRRCVLAEQAIVSSREK